MIALKKLYGEELLRLALMLSLLRAGPDQYLRDEARILAGGLVNGTDWAPEISSIHTRTRFLHPKSLDSILLDYERDVFEELHALGRWGNAGATREAVQAYLLNGVESNNAQAAATAEQTSPDSYQHMSSNQLENEDVEQCVTVKTEEHTPDEESEDDNVSQMHARLNPDTTLTLSASFIRNLTSFQGPLLEEDSAQSVPFDVSQFFANPVTIKQEIKEETGIKKEDVYADDNAIDDYVPFYMRGGDSITDQNLADLTDFAETAESLEEFKRNIEFLDVKQGQENLERYLIENTDLEVDEAGGSVCGVKRERASTSFTSSSGLGDEAYASSSCSNETQLADVKFERDEGLYSGDELTQEDMDLIEVLWKQDVDMGFCLDSPSAAMDPAKCALPYCSPLESSTAEAERLERDEIDRLKDQLKDECEPREQQPAATDKQFASGQTTSETGEDPWAGLDYTVDTETGEYVLAAGADRLNNLLEEALQLVGIEDGGELEELKPEEPAPPSDMLAGRYGGAGGAAHPHHPHHHHHLAHPHQHHHQQLAAAYHHQNLVRSMSMEQRWQDLATLLALPAQHAAQQHHHQQQQQHHHQQQQQQHLQHDQHDLYLGHGAQMSPGYVVPPYAPLSAEKPPIPSSVDLYGAGAGANLGSAVAASMNLPPGPAPPPPPPPPFYKAEHGPQHEQEQMYYQNTTAELSGNQDGFLSSILNDEDLQLMDMAMNEGMYTMRMLEGSGQQQQGGLHPPPHLAPHAPHLPQLGVPQPQQHSAMQHQLASMGAGSERIDASSDSAVSSMGSERVPSLSDSEWCDGGSDSAQDYHGKMRPCDESRQPPLVAQKKHHMFGKRCFQEQPPMVIRPRPQEPPVAAAHPLKFEYEQPPPLHTASYAPDVGHLTPEMKYSCTMEFNSGLGPANNGARHNHTYSLPPAPPQPPHRPLVRDKRGRRGLEAAGSCSAGGPMSRDEKRARALGIPMSVHDIINLPMDEFNERLSKHDLSETQLSLIRDIRRRGKNKVAAQNCRKRKLDQITSLADEVRDVRSRKQRLQRDHQMLTSERQRTKEHFAALYRHVFQHLRDSDGNPLSSQQYSLQQAADGAVVLVPRAPASRSSSDRHMSSSNATSEDELERIKIKQRKSFDQ